MTQEFMASLAQPTFAQGLVYAPIEHQWRFLPDIISKKRKGRV
jgi:hypothetical protein